MKMLPIRIMIIAAAIILILLMPTNKNAFNPLIFSVNMMQSEINSITTNHSEPSQNSTFRPVKASLLSPVNLLTGSEAVTQHANSRISKVSLAAAQAYLKRIYLSTKQVPDKAVNHLTDMTTYTF